MMQTVRSKRVVLDIGGWIHVTDGETHCAVTYCAPFGPRSKALEQAHAHLDEYEKAARCDPGGEVASGEAGSNR